MVWSVDTDVWSVEVDGTDCHQRFTDRGGRRHGVLSKIYGAWPWMARSLILDLRSVAVDGLECYSRSVDRAVRWHGVL